MAIITVEARIPDIADALALYDCVQVHRSTDAGASWTDLSADRETPARIAGTLPAPFAGLAGTSLVVVLSGGDPISVTFPAGEPTSLKTVLETIEAAKPGLASEAEKDSGKLALTSPLSGTGSTMTVTGTAASVLGLSAGKAAGKGTRLALTKPTIVYRFKDYDGDPGYLYKWRLFSSKTLAASPFSAPIQYDPAMVVAGSGLVTGTLRWATASGRPVVGRRVLFVPTDGRSFETDGKVYSVLPDDRPLEMVTDHTGTASIELYAGQRYVVHFEGTRFSRAFDAPHEDFDLMEVVAQTPDPFDPAVPDPMTIRTSWSPPEP